MGFGNKCIGKIDLPKSNDLSNQEVRKISKEKNKFILVICKNCGSYRASKLSNTNFAMVLDECQDCDK